MQSRGSDKNLEAGLADSGGQASSSSAFRQQSSAGNPTGGPILTSSQFRMIPGFMGANDTAESLLPPSHLDILVLYAKVSPGGATIPPATWQQDKDPVFIWEPPVEAQTVAGYSYALDATPDDTIDTTVTWFDVAMSPLVALADGQHTFAVNAINTEGSAGKPASLELWVDATPPHVTSTTPAAGALLNVAPAVTAVVSDNASGIDPTSVRLLLNDVPLTAAYNAATGTVSASGGAWTEGTNRLELQLADVAGNALVPLIWSVSLDTLPPIGTLTINAEALMTTSPYVTLTLSASDATSSVVTMLLSNDPLTGFVEEPYVSSRSLWALTPVRGLQSVYVKFVDEAGNVSPAVSDSIELALLAPETVITGGPAGYSPSQTVTFTYACPEGGCVFAYAFDGDAWSAWSPAASAARSALAFGNHYFRVKAAKDVNGTPGIQPDEEDLSPAERTWVVGVEPSAVTLPKGPPVKLWRLE